MNLANHRSNSKKMFKHKIFEAMMICDVHILQQLLSLREVFPKLKELIA